MPTTFIYAYQLFNRPQNNSPKLDLATTGKPFFACVFFVATSYAKKGDTCAACELTSAD